MNLQKLSKQTMNYVNKNGATILSFVAAVGVVTTTVSAIKATKKYEQLLHEKQADTCGELDPMDKARIAIPVYAPTVLLGVTTIGCIFGSNYINKQKQAALTSAYVALDATFKQYKEAAKRVYGEDADDKIMEEYVRGEECMDKISLYGEDRLFYEPMSRTYFESTLAEVKQAEYLLNRELALTDYVRINDFLRYLGQDETDMGDVLGWSTFGTHELYGHAWIDFKHELVVLEDGLECYIIRYPQEPRLDFMDY